jgi:hypothetical protein
VNLGGRRGIVSLAGFKADQARNLRLTRPAWQRRPVFVKKGGEFGMADAVVHEERHFY